MSLKIYPEIHFVGVIDGVRDIVGVTVGVIVGVGVRVGVMVGVEVGVGLLGARTTFRAIDGQVALKHLLYQLRAFAVGS